MLRFGLSASGSVLKGDSEQERVLGQLFCIKYFPDSCSILFSCRKFYLNGESKSGIRRDLRVHAGFVTSKLQKMWPRAVRRNKNFCVREPSLPPARAKWEVMKRGAVTRKLNRQFLEYDKLSFFGHHYIFMTDTVILPLRFTKSCRVVARRRQPET